MKPLPAFPSCNHTPLAIVSALRALGFTDADPLDVSDKPVCGMTYLSRVHEGQHQYCSVLADPWDSARLLQAVLLVYSNRFNSRAKVKQAPLHSNLAWSLEELLAMVERTYALPVSKP